MSHVSCFSCKRLRRPISLTLLLHLTPPPDSSCKPNFSQLIDGGGVTPGAPATTAAPTDDGAGFDAESIVGLVVWFVCVLYSSIR